MATWRFSAVCLLILTIVYSTLSCFDEVIHTSSGPVKGVITERYNRSMSYLGIPYAKPPVNELRFKKPQPVEQSSKILIADTRPPACIQYLSGERSKLPWYDNEVGKSEDCLYLNIYISRSQYKHERPVNLQNVMVWFHGGGFTVGSSRMSIYDGTLLASVGHVIVVTVNYRLGAFGFLNSGTEDAPGNVGLYDMIEALKWIQQNIGAFGGNKDQVTLFGHEAGAIAIGLLCVSPLAKGLFNKVILMSGSPAYMEAESNDKNVHISNDLAKKMGCATPPVNIWNHAEDVVQCLRGKDAMEIAETLSFFHPKLARSFYPNYGDEILPTNAREALILKQFHDVDVFVGNVKDEGSYILTTYDRDYFGFQGEAKPTLTKFGAKYIMGKLFKDYPNKDSVVGHYLNDVLERDSGKLLEQLITAVGDYYVLCPTKFFAEVYSETENQVYYYFFIHRPGRTPWAEWMGSVLFDDVPFVFGIPMKGVGYTTGEEALSRAMMEMFSNFAKERRPYAAYPKYSKSDEYEPNKVVVLNAVVRPPNAVIPIWQKDNVDVSYIKGPHQENCNFFSPHFGFH